MDTRFAEILELKPVQEGLLHFVKQQDVLVVLLTGCRKSLILHDQGFEYPKAAVLVVYPLRAIVDSHFQELKDYG